MNNQLLKQVLNKIKEVEKRKDMRLSDNGFFSIIGYLTLCFGKNWIEKDFSLILNAVRNCGKSTDIWKSLIIDIYWETLNWKIAYVRTNKEKSKLARADFNNKYKGKYYMSETHIYRIFLDDKGKRIFELDQEVGAILNVSGVDNYDSGIFADYHLIFWEEYNEITTNTGLYKKWLKLMTTIKRVNKPFGILLIGNKNNGNNDIMNKLEIIPSEINKESENGTKDVFINIDNENNMCFVDVALKTFEHLQEYLKPVLGWAKYDYETNEYLVNGKYLTNDNSYVVVYRKEIEPTKQAILNFCLDEFKFEYGKFGNENYYIHIVREFDNNLPFIALNQLGYMSNKKASKLDKKQEYKDLAMLLVEKHKKRRLYYSSFDAKNVVQAYILSTILFLDR